MFMDALSLGRVAALGAAFGSTMALGIMATIAVRTAWTVTRGHRWYQLKRL